GDVVFISSVIAGVGGTWTFRETLQRVRISNKSDKDIYINDIDVVDESQPLVWLDSRDTGIGGTPGDMSFSIVQEVAPTLIEITNTGNSDVYINGTIENPIGTTAILNSNGSVFATADRGVTTSGGPAGTANHQSMIRTHILRVDASENVGSGAERLNVDVVDSDGLPEDIGFKSSQVGGASDEIVLGIQNQYVTGQLVQYNAAGTALGGLSDGGYYYTIVSADGLRVALAATLTDAKAGNALDIEPTGTLTDAHTLTAKESFTVDADQNIFLDLKGLKRQDSAFHIIDIDRINAGDTVDVLLQTSLVQSGAGTSAGVLVDFDDANPAAGEPHYTFFDQNDGVAQPLSRGFFGQGNTQISATWDFRGRDPNRNGLYELAGLQSGSETDTGDIIVKAANTTVGAPMINVLAITEVAYTDAGTEEPVDDNGDITVETDGYIALTELNGDMRVERLLSTGSDVLLYSPQRIIDANHDVGPSVPADVSGVSITMVAASGKIGAPDFVNPDHADVAGEVVNPTVETRDGTSYGGIGRQQNFLEIDTNVAGGGG
ncbi:MAG TPA: hypothetical protein VIQ99_02330, partial [Gammaproteobacteria bacterium]